MKPDSQTHQIALVRRGFSRSGGAEAYLRRLATGLFENGCDVTLYNDRPWPEDYWPYPQMSISRAKRPREFSSAFHQLRDPGEIVFSMERVVGCDIYRAGDGVHASWLQRRAEHEPPIRSLFRKFSPKHRSLLALERRVFDAQHTRYVIANSEMVKAEIAGRFGYPKDRISVIYNGAPGPRTSEEQRNRRRAELGVDENECLVLFAGSGWERKGLRFAVEACRGIPNLTLAVAGRGKAPSDSDYVRYLGEVREMDSVYAAADLFILPTLYDPFSNASLEALAAGLPVITTRANGVSEILEEKKTGSVISDVRFPDQLKHAVHFWRNPENYRPAREVCRVAASSFSLETNTQKTRELILKVSAEKRQGFGDASGLADFE